MDTCKVISFLFFPADAPQKNINTTRGPRPQSLVVESLYLSPTALGHSMVLGTANNRGICARMTPMRQDSTKFVKTALDPLNATVSAPAMSSSSSRLALRRRAVIFVFDTAGSISGSAECELMSTFSVGCHSASPQPLFFLRSAGNAHSCVRTSKR